MAHDHTIPQRWAHYTAQDHAVWKTLFERQTALLPGLACADFVEGMRQLPLSAEQIPDFAELNKTLTRSTGWQVVAVPGLVPDEVFFEHLANRRFPSGNFIRGAHQLDYLQEPDVFHDVFGHVPMLMHPVMADFIQLYGQAGLRAQRIGKLTELARVYWYTVEFGLVRERVPGLHGRLQDALRIYGAGIASSFTESAFSVQSASPHRLGFDLERVMRTNYRIDDFQESYFVLNSLDDLLALARIDFDPIYERLNSGPNYAPGDVLPSDTVFQRGDGSYVQGQVRAVA
jgi:phenylalanine-4-hydroxylase